MLPQQIADEQLPNIIKGGNEQNGVASLTCGICAGKPLPSALKRANVAHLVTPMHVARQRIFVTPRRPARPKGLDLQIYVRVSHF